MGLQAIPTFYNGIKFRSRLEARWAYFFDLCKIKWNYELEGYELENARYLPDFYLPETETWVEVKPNLNFVNDEEVFKKVIEFTKACKKKKLIVFVDTPVKAKYYAYMGLTDVKTNKPSLNELKGVWLLRKDDQYQPLFYDPARTLLDVFFREASNKKF